MKDDAGGCCPRFRDSGAVRWPARMAAQAQTVTVFAAASLRDALDELARRREAGRRQGADLVRGELGAGAARSRSGAPADIFISADLDWMDYLEKRRSSKAGTRVNLVRNELVLIAPADSKVAVTIGPSSRSPQLLGDGRLAMADPDSVPAGKYGQGGARRAGGLGVGRAQGGAGGERAGRAGAGRIARRGAVRHRLSAPMRRPSRRCERSAGFAADLHPAIVYPAAHARGGQQPGPRQEYFCGSCVSRAGRLAAGTASRHRSCTVWSDAEESDIILLSLKVALWSVVVSLPFALAVALCARAPRVSRQEPAGRGGAPAARAAARGRRLFPAGPAGPARARSGAGWKSGSAIVVAFRWTGAAIACAVMGFPLMVRAIRLSHRGDRSRSWKPRRRRSARAACGASRPSRCRSRCRESSPASCFRSRAAWASSARPSRSSRTSRARRRRCRSRSMRSRRCPAATRRRCGCA